MADLTDLQAAGSTKIVGSDTSGLETNPVKVSANQDLNVSDVLDVSGVQGAISVSTTAVAVRVGVSNLANRKNMTFYNNGTGILYWGYTSGVTTATGTQIFRNQYVTGDWGPNTTIYLIAASGSHDVRVTEGA